MPDTLTLQKMSARFAPTEMTADLSPLSSADRGVLAKLVAASKIIDALFLRQVWAGNTALLMDLARDTTPEGRTRLHYFLINKGPWSRLDHDEPFVPGIPEKPAGANYYPADATRADLERWFQSLPGDARAKATGFFTVVRRTGATFGLGPYNVEYQGELIEAAALLRAAAQQATEPTLKRFLTTRAAAFLSNDYYESDVAWMELKGAIEPTIGPYEVYEDEFFNYKAAFEAFMTVQDEAETHEAAEVQRASCRTSRTACRSIRNTATRSSARSRRSSWSTRSLRPATPTAACRRPRSTCRTMSAWSSEKGAKRVMLKNVQDAKFAKTLVPISKVVLAPADQKDVAFDAFFTQIVVHELMHGLGPHNITVGGRETTVRQELKETYSSLEEAKADISGLFAIQHMIDKGALPKSLERPLYTTFLASAFRSIRFGINEAHGRGIAVQLN